MTRVYTEEVGSAGSPTLRRPIQARGVDRRLRALKPEILALVERIIDSGVIEKGPHVAALAREFQQLWLPFWPEMPEEDRVYLRQCVREVVNSGAGRRKVYAVEWKAAEMRRTSDGNNNSNKHTHDDE